MLMYQSIKTLPPPRPPDSWQIAGNFGIKTTHFFSPQRLRSALKPYYGSLGLQRNIGTSEPNEPHSTSIANIQLNKCLNER